MTTFNIFHTTRVRTGVRDAPHIWGAGEIRDAGERRLFGGLARSEPFVTPHVWGTGEMSTEISATYLGRCGNKHWKSRGIYVALGHDELRDTVAQNIAWSFDKLIGPWKIWMQFYKRNFYSHFTDWYLQIFWRQCPQMNTTELYWWQVNIGWGNGLVPSCIKPLPGPMLTQIYVAVWHH